MSPLHHLTLQYRQSHGMNVYDDTADKSLYEYTLKYRSTLDMERFSRGYVQAISENDAVQKLCIYYGDKLIPGSITVQRTDLILLED